MDFQPPSLRQTSPLLAPRLWHFVTEPERTREGVGTELIRHQARKDNAGSEEELLPTGPLRPESFRVITSLAGLRGAFRSMVNGKPDAAECAASEACKWQV